MTSSSPTPQPAAPVRVYLVEDEPRVRKHLCRLLERDPRLSLVGSAGSAEDALREVAACRPEVVLLDLGLPGLSGTEATPRFREAVPGAEVLVLTVFDDDDLVFGAVSRGASGYLLKGTPTDRVVEAILDVRAGGSVIQPTLARRLLARFCAIAETRSPERPVPSRLLSPREQEILEIIAKGVSNAEAAQALGLSRATVRTHLEHIYQKLDVSNRVEAVTEGIRRGLLSP